MQLGASKKTTSNVLCVCALSSSRLCCLSGVRSSADESCASPLTVESRDNETRYRLSNAREKTHRGLFLSLSSFSKQQLPLFLLNLFPRLLFLPLPQPPKKKKKKNRTAPSRNGPPSSSASATPSPRGPWAPTGSPGSPTPSPGPLGKAAMAVGTLESSSSTPASRASSPRRSPRASSGASRPARGASSACS